MNKKLLTLCLSPLLLSAVLAGCSSNASVPGSGSSGSGGNGTSPGQTSSEPPLVVGDSTTGLFAARNFNPYASGNLWGTAGAIYEPLFYFSNVNGKTFPLLGLNYTWKNGEKTLLVNLRKGVQWNDGKAFTSNDVVFTYNLLKKYPSIDGYGVWQQINGVKALGPYQVEFTFKKANPTFVIYLLTTLVVPEHIYGNLKTDPTKWTDPNPVGTGPYTVKSFTPQVFYLQANPNYWGGKPKVSEIEFPSYNGNESANLALSKGKFDWGGYFMPNIQSTYINKNSQANHYWFPPGAPVMLYPNQKDPLLSQLPVRKAISMAINREPLYKVAEYGYEPVASLTGLTLPNQQSWVDPNLPKSDLYQAYDTQGAIKVLENAGYKKGSDGMFRSPDGKKLQFTLNVVAGWTDWDEQCTMIAQFLKQAGIEIHVRQLQYGDWWNQLTTGKYQLSMCWSTMGPNPYYFYYNLLWPKSSNNFEGWNNSQATNYLNQFQNTINKSQQKQAIYALEKYTAENLPAIPLVYGANWYEYQSNHYVGWPSASNPYVDPSPWGVSTEIVLMHLKPAH